MIRIGLLVLAAVLLAACERNSGASDIGILQSDERDETAPVAEPAPTHLGECILLEPSGDVPDDVYAIGEVAAAEGIAPFTKDLTAHGLRLVGRDDVSHDFMRVVARTIEEMFPRDDGLDLAVQREVLANHYRYKALIPIPVDGDFSFMEDNADQFERLARNNSICDVIMQGAAPQGQVMEVVEHILHYVTDIGLHYAYPDSWGINEHSSLAVAMQKAIDAGYYDVNSYDDIDDPEVRYRVMMQEFAYWFISTAWDLQEPYGPIEEQEWTIRNSTELQTKMPEMYAVYERTAARVMVAPSPEILQELGPLRNPPAAD